MGFDFENSEHMQGEECDPCRAIFSRRLLTIQILSLLSSLFCPWFAQLALVLSQSIKDLNRAFDWWKRFTT